MDFLPSVYWLSLSGSEDVTVLSVGAVSEEVVSEGSDGTVSDTVEEVAASEDAAELTLLETAEEGLEAAGFEEDAELDTEELELKEIFELSLSFEELFFEEELLNVSSRFGVSL